MLNVKKWSTQWGGRELSVEVGKLSLLTNAACTVQYGETVIMATVVKSSEARDLDYFPLTVDFEERLYAAGKIKGSRFIKREGRPSDEAVLSGRMIDRTIRPLFDDRMRNDVQVILTALAIDSENDAAITALIAASAALSLSSVRWSGPIAGARVGRNKEGQFILNVTSSELEENSDLDLIVAGTADKVIMVEAGAKEIPEDVMYSAMKWAGEQYAPIVSFIEKIQKEAGQEKDPEPVIDAALETTKAFLAVKQLVSDVADSMIFNTPKVSRTERKKMVSAIEAKAKEKLIELAIDPSAFGAGLKQVKLFVSEEISKRIMTNKQRLDGRTVTEIRELTSEIDLLPRVHGSGMFMRGDTQVLSVVTLGAPGDVQTLDSMEEDGTKRYMHHYNDTPATYGETGMMRGPGRRAIGHGALAERALEPVLPSQETFPYTMRVVSEVLGSNGSSSMASTCGSTLSLMAAGVPITKPVAGIAMGLASGENGAYEILTDLQDVEDGPGGMDFKIAGTADGITAIQMDTKTLGLTWEIVEKTLKQSKEARTTILAQMATAIAAPRAELSKHAPRIETIMINPEKIRDVIGPGGKVINKIIDETGVQIDIEQDGRVMITSNDAEGMKRAIEIVKQLTHEVEAGEEYEGAVVRLEDFGAFVNILPGKDGLVHVSEISYDRVNKPSDVLKMGDKVKVKVKEIDAMGRVNLSMKVLLPKPEGYVEPEPRAPRPAGDRPRFGGGRRP